MRRWRFFFDCNSGKKSADHRNCSTPFVDFLVVSPTIWLPTEFPQIPVSHFPNPPMTSSEDRSFTNDLFVGVDVGGTNIKLGIVRDDGTVVAHSAFSTCQEKGPDDAFRRTREQLDQLVSRYAIDRRQICAAGLGTPGPMNIPTGMILEPVNMPGWKNFPVRDRLAEHIQMPVWYTNDANAAAFGEYWAGAGKSFSSMVLFTLGTGVGGGIIVDDMTIEGSHSVGAELGHICIDSSASALVCSCGQRGHLEAYAGAAGVLSRCQAGLELNPSSSLNGLKSDELTPLAISNAADEGDLFALELIQKTAEHVAAGIALVAHVIDPEVFMIGGAMTFGGSESPVGRGFIDRMRQKTREMVFPVIAADLKIDFASLGSDAGFIGAAGIARSGFRRQNPAG